MWYAEIISPLLTKITTKEKQGAQEFLLLFFEAFDGLMFKSTRFRGEPHLELILGIVSKLFKKFGEKRPDTISLRTFSRYLLGLTVIYAKKEKDSTEVWNRHFIPLLANKKIIEALGFHGNYVTKINRVERRVLADLKFNLKVNFKRVSALLRKMTPSSLREFFEKAAMVLGINSKFDQFLLRLYNKTHASLDAQTKLTRPELDFSHLLILLADLIDEIETEDNKVVQQTKEFITKLTLVSQMHFLHRTSQSYHDLKRVCLADINNIAMCFMHDSRIKWVLNRLYFSLMKLGLFHICYREETAPLLKDEIHFLMQFEALENAEFDNELSCKARDRLIVMLSDLIGNYLQNKNAIDFRLLCIQCKEAIQKARAEIEKDPKGKLHLQRLEFALIGLGLTYQNRRKKGETNKERKFFNLLNTVEKRVAEFKNAMIFYPNENASFYLEKLERFVLILNDQYSAYLLYKNTPGSLKQFTNNIITIITEAKSVGIGLLGSKWKALLVEFEMITNELEIEQRMISNQTKKTALREIHCVEPQKITTPNKNEDNFKMQLNKLNELTKILYFKASANGYYAFSARMIEIIVAVVEISAGLYLENKTESNYQIFKTTCVDVINYFRRNLRVLQKIQEQLILLELAINDLNSTLDQATTSRYHLFQMPRETQSITSSSHQPLFSV